MDVINFPKASSSLQSSQLNWFLFFNREDFSFQNINSGFSETCYCIFLSPKLHFIDTIQILINLGRILEETTVYIIHCEMSTLFYLLQLHHHTFGENWGRHQLFFQKKPLLLTSRLSQLSSQMDLHWARFLFSLRKRGLVWPCHSSQTKQSISASCLKCQETGMIVRVYHIIQTQEGLRLSINDLHKLLHTHRQGTSHLPPRALALKLSCSMA